MVIILLITMKYTADYSNLNYVYSAGYKIYFKNGIWIVTVLFLAVVSLHEVLIPSNEVLQQEKLSPTVGNRTLVEHAHAQHTKLRAVLH